MSLITQKIKEKQIKNSHQILVTLTKSFENPKILENAIVSTFLDPIDVPQNEYSRTNRILLAIQGAYDARGSSTWRGLKKFPLNWSNQVFIMMPKVIKIKDKEDEDKSITTGFFFKGLYDAENVYGGKPIEYVKNPPKSLPPLADVATKWGVNIQYKVRADAWGSYDTKKNEIQLSTDAAGTFFHELAHKAHEKIDGKLKGGQDPQQEAIAQLSAAVLAQMYDKKIDLATYNYILHYAKEDPTKAMKLISKVLKKTGQVLDLILETTDYDIMVKEVAS